jgi:endonuclease/exonuclease/phosphatase family metal-dependent hydrolase
MPRSDLRRSAPPPDGRLTILHWNIHSWRDQDGNSNLTAVTGLIGETAPHLVSLVEVDENWGAPAALREVADRCGYAWLFVPAFEFGHDAPGGGFGNALLTTLPILAVHQWQLLWPPRLYDRTEPSEQRSVLLARLDGPNAPFWAGVTHLPREDGVARTGALNRLLTLANSTAEPWLYCGDFNTPASSWLGSEPDVTVSAPVMTYPVDDPAEPIDYCVASPSFSVQAQALPVAGSDHLPLLLDVRRSH